MRYIMKKVLKLIAEIFCVLLPLLFIWIYIWVRPLGFVDNEAPHYFWNKEVTNTTHDKYYKTIILGDSAAMQHICQMYYQNHL